MAGGGKRKTGREGTTTRGGVSIVNKGERRPFFSLTSAPLCLRSWLVIKKDISLVPGAGGPQSQLVGGEGEGDLFFFLPMCHVPPRPKKDFTPAFKRVVNLSLVLSGKTCELRCGKRNEKGGGVGWGVEEERKCSNFLSLPPLSLVSSLASQPPTVVCKMETESRNTYTLHTHCTFGANLRSFGAYQ